MNFEGFLFAFVLNDKLVDTGYLKTIFLQNFVHTVLLFFQHTMRQQSILLLA